MLTGDNKWNSRKEPPQPLTTPADFTRENTHTGIIENVNRREPRRGECNTV